MVFASDLDGTLIFSKRYLAKLQEPLGDSLHLIETIDDREISYVTQRVIEKLKLINERIFFVPVTTRTIQQYRRITLFQGQIKPSYAIVTNGANILLNGEPMVEWQQLMERRLKDSALSLWDVQKKFKENTASQWVISSYTADDMFLYFTLDQERVQREDFLPFFDWLRENQWAGSLQGRKLYFIPKCLNKAVPLEFLKEKINMNELIAAGDSLLDLPMLELADYAIAPFHGELKESLALAESRGKGIQYTTRRGIKASEEILKLVLKKIEETS